MSTWPPKPYDRAFAQIAESHAWWAGNVNQLSSRYGYPAPHPNQMRGGIVGAVARMWMGKPTGVGESSDKLHVPLPADLCHLSATSLFDTPPTVGLSADEDNPEAMARIDALVNTQKFAANLLVAAELCAAQGGVYGRVVFNTTVKPEPWIDWVQANQAIPEWHYGELFGVKFWRILPSEDDKTVWRHMEHYTPGWIEHTLWEGKADDLGRKVDLEAHTLTAPLASEVQDGGFIPTGGTMLAAAYIPNAKPNVEFINEGELSHLGKSDLAPELFPLFDKLNMAYSSLMRDVRLGRARIIASEQLLDDRGAGKGQSFDMDREIFTKVAGGPNGESLIEAKQFEIRVDDHLKVVEDLTIKILRRAGYSAMSLGMDTAGVAQTATEIKTKSRATRSTTKAKGRYWADGISHLTAALLEIDRDLGNTKAVLEHLPTVELSDPVEETELDAAMTIQALDAATAISTDTKVRMLHPEWESTKQDAEIDRILKEKGVDFDPFGIPDVDPLAPTVDPVAPPKGEGLSPDDLSKTTTAIGNARRAGVTDDSIKAMSGLSDLEFIDGARPITMKYKDEE
ncbi:phage portal protein [Corynebacterium sp. A21]|uniref:phage portal protein n=1 Tax=Corynebacterium sp. A21 TaxID=3457318 RepID=UPI003FD2770A